MASNSLNFLQKMASQRFPKLDLGNDSQTRQPPSTQAVVVAPTAKVVTRGSKFTHSKNIIMTRGFHKGYYGYITQVIPSRAEVEILEKQYVHYDPKYKIGDKIGKNIITNIIPSLYGILVNQGDRIVELRFPSNVVLPVVVYKKNNQFRLGYLINIQKPEKNIICDIVPLRLKYSDSAKPTELFDQLSTIIKQDKLQSVIRRDAQFVTECQMLNVELPEHYFVLAKPENPNDEDFQGVYGKVNKIIDQQFEIVKPKTIFINPNYVKENADGSAIITQGMYKNQIVKFIKKHPKSFMVYLDTIGKKINYITVKKCDPNVTYQDCSEYSQQPITEQDMFYMDLLLNNGNLFEVKSIRPNGIIYGIEKVNGEFVSKEISDNDIKYLQPGFSFSEESQPIFQQELDNEIEYIIQSPSEEDRQDQEENDQEENDQEEQEQQEFNLDDQRMEENNMVSTFRDIERVGYESKILTPEEKSIRDKIQKISNLFGIPDLEIYNIITDVISAINYIKQLLANQSKQELKTYWKASDEKFIIAVLVLNNIIKNGYAKKIGSDNILLGYVQKLIKKYINVSKDVSNSIFIKNDWSSIKVDQDMVSNLYKSNKDEDKISLLMLIINNCYTLLKNTFNLLSIQTKISSDSSIIKLERKRKDLQKSIVGSKLLTGEEIPKEAESVTWGINFLPIIKKYKDEIRSIIELNPKESDNNKIYTFILNNLDQSYFVIPKFESHLKMTEKKYTTLLNVFKQLSNEVSKSKSLSENKMILEKYLAKLQDTINEQDASDLTKEVYQFVYDNLKNGASVLKQMKTNYDLDKQKYNILKQFYNKFIDDAKNIQNKLESEKKAKILSNIEKRELEKVTREEAMKKSGRIMPQEIDELEDNYKIIESISCCE